MKEKAQILTILPVLLFGVISAFGAFYFVAKEEKSAAMGVLAHTAITQMEALQEEFHGAPRHLVRNHPRGRDIASCSQPPGLDRCIVVLPPDKLGEGVERIMLNLCVEEPDRPVHAQPHMDALALTAGPFSTEER